MVCWAFRVVHEIWPHTYTCKLSRKYTDKLAQEVLRLYLRMIIVLVALKVLYYIVLARERLELLQTGLIGM